MSLAPSSTMTASMSGPSTVPIRASPPALVSPGTPALITVASAAPWAWSQASSCGAKPSCGGRPEPAVSESPKARMRTSAVAAPASARTKARAGTSRRRARDAAVDAAEGLHAPTLRGNAEAVNIPRAAGGGR